MSDVSYQTIEVAPLSRAVGGLISGVNLAAGVSDEQFSEIRAAFADRGVIFFRDQDLSPEQHIAWAERWGRININRFFKPVEGHPQIAEVRKEPEQTQNIGQDWHTDHSYDQEPAMGSVLYALEVPDVGGDTVFAGQAAAYESLSDGLKATLSGLWAEHTSRRAFGETNKRAMTTTGDRIGNPEAATQDAVHPVIIRHPLSGRPCLYVNGSFTVKFQGWTEHESRPLLKYLYQRASHNDVTCRFKWEAGSMAIWDNRAVQHIALNDYHGERRLMHRITVEGVKLEPAH